MVKYWVTLWCEGDRQVIVLVLSENLKGALNADLRAWGGFPREIDDLSERQFGTLPK